MPSPATLYLIAAIAAEVIATTALARTEGFSRVVPSLVTFTGYAIAFWCLAQTLTVLPVGVVYAVWSGLGIVAIAAIAWLVFGQRLDLPAILGLGLIVAGVLVINLFSTTLRH